MRGLILTANTRTALPKLISWTQQFKLQEWLRGEQEHSHRHAPSIRDLPNTTRAPPGEEHHCSLHHHCLWLRWQFLLFDVAFLVKRAEGGVLFLFSELKKDSLKCAWGCSFFYFPKYFSLFFRLIYLKDHQGTKPHVRFMLYHLFFNHKQDFKQNRVIYIVLRHVNRCSRQGLDPKSMTDLPPAKACTNYSFRRRGMIKFFHQESSLGLVSSAPPHHGADQR